MKCFCTITFTLIFIFINNSFALTATVQDAAGNPLQGVEISFANIDTVLFVDSSGEFSFDKETPVIQNLILNEQVKFIIRGKTFSLGLPKSKKVNISIFNTKGQEVMSFKKILSCGMHNIKLPILASGMYIINSKIGSEKFTKKFISQDGFYWSSIDIQKAVSTRAGRVVVDTVYFNYTGFSEVTKIIDSYDVDLGTIVMAEEIYNKDWYGFEEFDIDTAYPNFVNILFRAYDQYGFGIDNIDTSRFTVLEDSIPITSESELIIERATTFNDTIRTVMLLDHSKSVEVNLLDIKNAAKQMVRNIAPHQEIAIYAFSESCIKFSNFSSDTTVLLNAINSIPIGLSSTNLYGALIECFGLIDNYASIVNKTIVFGNVVLFTDGRDTQGLKTLAEVLAVQADRQVFSLGLGNELDTFALKQLSGDFLFQTNDVAELSQIFEEVQNQISTIANSFYWAHYRSPKRGNVDHILEMLVDSNSNGGEDASVNGIFNSEIFKAGWAPTAESLDIYINDAKDSLLGTYVYADKDGETEGQSIYRWYRNSSKVDTGNIAIPSTEMKYKDKIIFQVKPVSLFGSPNEGKWAACTLSFGEPVINNISITTNITKDTLIGSYDYSGLYPEGESEYKWYLEDLLIYSDLNLPISVLENAIDLSADMKLSLIISPVSISGIPKVGQPDTLEKYLYNFFNTPSIINCSMEIKETKDSIVGTYKYYHDVDEDTTFLSWYKNGEKIISGVTAISTSGLANGDTIKWELIPVCDSGLVKIGRKHYEHEIVIKRISYQDSIPSSNMIRDGIVADSGFILVKAGANAMVRNTFLIKANEVGKNEWTKTLPMLANSITATDSSFILSGYKYVGSNEPIQLHLINVDSSANIIWEKTYFYSWGSEAAKTIPLNDDFLVASRYRTSFNGEYELMLLKVNGSGDTLWTRKYDDTDTLDIEIADIAPTPDGGCIIVANSERIYNPIGGVNSWNNHIFKISNNGVLNWSKDIGFYADGVTVLLDGSFFVTGRDEDTWQKLHLIKYSSTGSILINKTIADFEDSGKRNLICFPEGIVITGKSKSIMVNIDGEKIWENNRGGDICFISPSGYVTAYCSGVLSTGVSAIKHSIDGNIIPFKLDFQ